jgi:hypothetical protein
MDMPRGLRKPHHYAEIVPPLLALIGVATASYYAIAHILRTTVGL